jgi:hypothetical protein
VEELLEARPDLSREAAELIVEGTPEPLAKLKAALDSGQINPDVHE